MRSWMTLLVLASCGFEEGATADGLTSDCTSAVTHRRPVTPEGDRVHVVALHDGRTWRERVNAKRTVRLTYDSADPVHLMIMVEGYDRLHLQETVRGTLLSTTIRGVNEITTEVTYSREVPAPLPRRIASRELPALVDVLAEEGRQLESMQRCVGGRNVVLTELTEEPVELRDCGLLGEPDVPEPAFDLLRQACPAVTSEPAFCVVQGDELSVVGLQSEQRCTIPYPTGSGHIAMAGGQLYNCTDASLLQRLDLTDGSVDRAWLPCTSVLAVDGGLLVAGSFYPSFRDLQCQRSIPGGVVTPIGATWDHLLVADEAAGVVKRLPIDLSVPTVIRPHLPVRTYIAVDEPVEGVLVGLSETPEGSRLTVEEGRTLLRSVALPDRQSGLDCHYNEPTWR